MKKTVLMSIVAIFTILGCKKESENKESNVMLEEPEVKTVVSENIKTPNVNTTIDSNAVKVDSASVKK